MTETKKLWQHPKFKSTLGQAIVVAIVVLAFAFLGHNLDQSLKRLGIRLGFKFLNSQAGFSIGESIIPYDPSQPYARVLLVGFLNSLRVILSSMVLATAIGLVAGIARLSDNWLVRQIAKVYVETLRNLPLLIQLLFWYFVVFLTLPKPENAINLGIIQISRSGVNLFGLALSPEFSSLCAGLTFYTGTFIAEIVRGGIQGVHRGQKEAAQALGLSSSQTLKLVILPQALRSMIPSLSNQYLNLCKNSSLAIAIGYPDLYAISSTTFNQTGRAVEMMILISVTYLAMSLTIALLLNLYNNSIQWRTR
jgi:general L-amino acid transport system permease protein